MYKYRPQSSSHPYQLSSTGSGYAAMPAIRPGVHHRATPAQVNCLTPISDLGHQGLCHAQAQPVLPPDCVSLLQRIHCL